MVVLTEVLIVFPQTYNDQSDVVSALVAFRAFVYDLFRNFLKRFSFFSEVVDSLCNEILCEFFEKTICRENKQIVRSFNLVRVSLRL
jgi:hypothetical protein